MGYNDTEMNLNPQLRRPWYAFFHDAREPIHLTFVNQKSKHPREFGPRCCGIKTKRYLSEHCFRVEDQTSVSPRTRRRCIWGKWSSRRWSSCGDHGEEVGCGSWGVTSLPPGGCDLTSSVRHGPPDNLRIPPPGQLRGWHLDSDRSPWQLTRPPPDNFPGGDHFPNFQIYDMKRYEAFFPERLLWRG